MFINYTPDTVLGPGNRAVSRWIPLLCRQSLQFSWEDGSHSRDVASLTDGEPFKGLLSN